MRIVLHQEQMHGHFSIADNMHMMLHTICERLRHERVPLTCIIVS